MLNKKNAPLRVECNAGSWGLRIVWRGSSLKAIEG